MPSKAIKKYSQHEKEFSTRAVLRFAGMKENHHLHHQTICEILSCRQDNRESWIANDERLRQFLDSKFAPGIDVWREQGRIVDIPNSDTYIVRLASHEYNLADDTYGIHDMCRLTGLFRITINRDVRRGFLNAWKTAQGHYRFVNDSLLVAYLDRQAESWIDIADRQSRIISWTQNGDAVVAKELPYD